MIESKEDIIHDNPERTAAGIVGLLVASVLALTLVSGCAFLENKAGEVIGPGPDGVMGTADDELGPDGDSALTEFVKTFVVPVATLLGAGAVGAGAVAISEGASGIATSIKNRKKDA